MPEKPSVFAAVRNDRIQFATMRPPGSRFATLERRVVITGPAELVELAASGDASALEPLVGLLNQPDRAWAAEVMLAAMTRREEKIVDTFSTKPDEWWNSLGANAQQRWSAWLAQARPRLVWDSADKAFRERE